MKKCVTCNKEYDDSKQFCPACGSKLTDADAAAAPVEAAPVEAAPVEAAAPSASSTASSGGFDIKAIFEKWNGSILTVLAVVIEWYFSLVFGFIVAILGIVLGWKSGNQTNKIVSIVVGVIAILLFIVYSF